MQVTVNSSWGKELKYAIERFIRGIDKSYADMMKETAQAIFDELQRTTPKFSAQARANWTVSLGSPRIQFVEAIPYAEDSALGLQAINASFVATVLANYKRGAIYITNHAPYIDVLNDGYSKQAPARFVEAAVEYGMQVVRSKRFTL